MFLLGSLPLGRGFTGLPIGSLAQGAGYNTHWAQVNSIYDSRLCVRLTLKIRSGQQL